MKILLALSGSAKIQHDWIARLQEVLGVKFNPMGEGSSYLSKGMLAKVSAKQAQKVKRVLNSLGWRAAVKTVVPPPVRTDGVWMAPLGELATPTDDPDHRVPMVFISRTQPGDETASADLILRFRPPFSRRK